MKSLAALGDHRAVAGENAERRGRLVDAQRTGVGKLDRIADKLDGDDDGRNHAEIDRQQQQAHMPSPARGPAGPASRGRWPGSGTLSDDCFAFRRLTGPHVPLPHARSPVGISAMPAISLTIRGMDLRAH
jgi:hypothetical protein